MPNPNFIRDYPVPLDLSPGDQMPVQPAGPRTNDYVAPTLAEHWIAGMNGTYDGVNRNTGGINVLSGPTSSRPSLPFPGIAIIYFDTTLGIPIFGLNTGWVSVGGMPV